MSVLSRFQPNAAAAAMEGNSSYLLFLLQCFYLYWLQLVIFTVLSVMALFRREMSSNRVYMERHESEQRDSTKERSERPKFVILDQDVTDIDEMLEGAGNIYGPVMSVAPAVWARMTLAKFRVVPYVNASIVGNAPTINAAKFGGGNVSKARAESLSLSMQGKDADEGSGSNHDDNSGEGKSDKQCYSVEAEGNERRLAHHTMTILDQPPDAHIHILSFLHPCDVLTFACASRGAHAIVDDEEAAEEGHSTSLLLWKELWKRDYNWIVTEWEVGREALARSLGRGSISPSRGSDAKFGKMNSAFKHLESSVTAGIEHGESDSNSQLQSPQEISDGVHADDLADTSPTQMSMKDFYFTFGETWLNYAIAGQNTSSRCLVGLHGHIFDITDFFEQHPGSPETLLVQSGRDATSFFEEIGHSVGARKMAMAMCVVLDRSCVAGTNGKRCGLLRTGIKRSLSEASQRKIIPKASWARSQTARNAIPMARSKPRRPGTLARIRSKIDREELEEQIRAEMWLSSTLTRDGILGNIHVYYDVFVGRWMPWYTDLQFEPVFLDRIDGA